MLARLLCRKSFIETRSIGAVAVAFSRVYILHAILLCWMSLLVGVCLDRVLTAVCYATVLRNFQSSHNRVVGISKRLGQAPVSHTDLLPN